MDTLHPGKWLRKKWRRALGRGRNSSPVSETEGSVAQDPLPVAGAPREPGAPGANHHPECGHARAELQPVGLRGAEKEQKRG